MIRSVQWRLVLNTVLVSLVAILCVGMVTIFLVNTYFTRQEEEYLRLQASRIEPSILQALYTGNLVELQRTVAMGAIASQVRVQLYDSSDQLIADSGIRTDQTTFNPIDSARPELYVGAVLDDSGQILRISPLISRQSDPFDGAELSLISPAQLIAPLSSFTSVSDANLVTPLLLDSEIIAYLNLSEGPAVGSAVSRSIWIGLAIGSVAALAVAALVGLFSARQVVGPLQNLGAAVEAMSSDNLNARAPGSDIREFDQLASQFNTMADQLTGTIDRLNHERGILRRAISDAGHEFRTPLTALKTFNSLLEEETGNSETGSIYVSESGRQIDQMQQITDDILDLSRLEARLSGTNFSMGDLRDPITAAVQNMQPMINAKNISLSLELPQNAVRISFDQAAVRQAIANLLSNAIKYTPEGGAVAVALEKRPDLLRIRVTDNGIGIPNEIIPFIFDRFFRYPSNSAEGTGLGLAICREIVEIHLGQIGVESQLDQGSEFTITLPLPDN